jgi:hypothetical protein
MPWKEALNLTWELAKDSSSHVGAAIREWQFPASLEYLASMVQSDNYIAIKSAKRNAKVSGVAAPWDKPIRRIGTASMSMEAMRQVLDHHRAIIDAEGG